MIKVGALDHVVLPWPPEVLETKIRFIVKSKNITVFSSYKTRMYINDTYLYLRLYLSTQKNILIDTCNSS